MKGFTLREWVIFLIIFLIFLLLSGCALKPPVERYKIIAAKPVVKTKVITKTVSRKCPALPPLSENASPIEKNQHHIRVIEMYVECRK